MSANGATTRVLRGAQVFDGDRFYDDVPVTMANGDIESIGGHVPPDADIVDLDGGLLVPGFVDLQVNGGGGRLLNSEPTVDALRTIVAAHRRRGTTACLPTVISDSVETQRQAVAAVIALREAGEAGILGVHLEGPHLAPARRGVHRETWFRPLADADVQWLADLARHLRVLVTVAPERVDPGQIRALADGGVVVCAGHTEASYAQLATAAAHGLAGFTHLYNAMGALGSREPGAVGAALDLDDCACGIIVDGQHVSAPSVRIAARAKPAGKLFLVSDAMATAGSDLDTFELYGETVRVIDGCLRNAEGVLAGSTITLLDAVRIAHRDVGLPLAECLRMASLYPAAFIGAGDRLGRIHAGYRADLVHLDENLGLLNCWVGGIDRLEAACGS